MSPLTLAANDIVLQFYIVDELEKMGVMPMVNSHVAMRNHIDQLAPEEARKVRRKFRKAWRKLVKSRFGENEYIAKLLYGKGMENPSPKFLNDRRQIVYQEAFDRAVARRHAK